MSGIKDFSILSLLIQFNHPRVEIEREPRNWQEEGEDGQSLLSRSSSSSFAFKHEVIKLYSIISVVVELKSLIRGK